MFDTPFLYWLLIIMSCLFCGLFLNNNQPSSRSPNTVTNKDRLESVRGFTNPPKNIGSSMSTSISPSSEVRFNNIQETIRYNKKKPVTSSITKEIKIEHDLDTITESSNEEPWNQLEVVSLED
jgi:hypothetical protein